MRLQGLHRMDVAGISSCKVDLANGIKAVRPCCCRCCSSMRNRLSALKLQPQQHARPDLLGSSMQVLVQRQLAAAERSGLPRCVPVSKRTCAVHAPCG